MAHNSEEITDCKTELSLNNFPSKPDDESLASICGEYKFNNELAASLQPPMSCHEVTCNLTEVNNTDLDEYFSNNSYVPYEEEPKKDECNDCIAYTAEPERDTLSPIQMFRHPFLPTVTLVVPMPLTGLTFQPSVENKRNLRVSARLLRFCAKDSSRETKLKKHRWKSGWKLSLVKRKTRRWPLVAGSIIVLVILYCCWRGYKAVSHRYCDQCTPGEVCVALPGEEIPMCRLQIDPSDITGCGGLCRLGLESCQRLFHDAYRCLDDTICYENEFKCENMLCIPEIKRCDGHMNCYDRTDEFNCPCNLKTHFHCGNNTSCLPVSKRCNRVIDCWDGSDEANCTQACFQNDQFTCTDGQCISTTFFCDGVSDCEDGSDEPMGCDDQCFNSDWRCDHSRCLPKALRCDDKKDCKDGSDEMYCNVQSNK